MAKKAWRLIFAEGLLDNYMDGESHWTFRIHRPGSNDFTKGQIIEGHFKDGGGVMLLMEIVEQPIVKPFSKTTVKERREWNNGTDIYPEDMIEILEQYNSGVTKDTVASLIKLRLARVDDRPIAGPLPELP